MNNGHNENMNNYITIDNDNSNHNNIIKNFTFTTTLMMKITVIKTKRKKNKNSSFRIQSPKVDPHKGAKQLIFDTKHCKHSQSYAWKNLQIILVRNVNTIDFQRNTFNLVFLKKAGWHNNAADYTSVTHILFIKNEYKLIRSTFWQPTSHLSVLGHVPQTFGMLYVFQLAW